MSYQDRTLNCVDCGQPFTFSAEDQAYHAEKGYSNDPKRCPTCRQSRRDNRSSGGYGSGGGYGGGGGGLRREMFPAVCSNCGKDTEVPFQPRADRPVYCRECYDQVGGRQRR